MISVDDALARILALIPPPVAQTVPLAQASGRVLAAPLVARLSQPPFDASAMDGYAVRATDVRPGQPLRLIGVAQAGQRFAGMMTAGQCVRIFTGAPLPLGADAVIMQEEAVANGNEIRFTSIPALGQSVRARGNDFAEGQRLLPPGTVLTPARLSLAAAANCASIAVTRRPRIAILATGDELVTPGTSPGPDQIIASNSFGLAALFARHAAEILDLGIVHDDRKALETALLRAFDAGVDVLVTTGGASVGDRDFVQEALVDLGGTLDFWKIAMRPGKPLMFGTRGKTLIFGLPGNPVSAMVTGIVIVLPALRQLTGRTEILDRRLWLPLDAALPPNGPRRHFLRGRLHIEPTGTSVALIAETDSGHTSSLAMADVLIVQPENDPGQPEGAPVEVILL